MTEGRWGDGVVGEGWRLCACGGGGVVAEGIGGVGRGSGDGAAEEASAVFPSLDPLRRGWGWGGSAGIFFISFPDV